MEIGDSVWVPPRVLDFGTIPYPAGMEVEGLYGTIAHTTATIVGVKPDENFPFLAHCQDGCLWFLASKVYLRKTNFIEKASKEIPCDCPWEVVSRQGCKVSNHI